MYCGTLAGFRALCVAILADATVTVKAVYGRY